MTMGKCLEGNLDHPKADITKSHRAYRTHILRFFLVMVFTCDYPAIEMKSLKVRIHDEYPKEDHAKTKENPTKLGIKSTKHQIQFY